MCIRVRFEIGEYYADIIVNDCIIVELKAAEAICPEHEAQPVSYTHLTLPTSDLV